MVNLGGIACRKLLYLYIYDELWIIWWYLGIANVDIREIWWHNLEKGVSLIWEGPSPIAYLVFLTISINFHKPMSVEYIFSIAGVFTVAHIYIYRIIQILYIYDVDGKTVPMGLHMDLLLSIAVVQSFLGPRAQSPDAGCIVQWCAT